MGVREWLHACLPKTLRTKLLVMSFVVVSLPIATCGYLLEREGRHALLREKQEKLFGIARTLDGQLGTGFDQWLDGRDAAPDRATAIRRINARLTPFTDVVAEANPGVGVGYYSKALNAIVTYGPSRLFGNTVGTPIPSDHPGWRVLETGRMALETGPQVRGMIMNAMWPIVRDGTVIGYIWANELADDVERQAAVMDRAVLAVSAAGILFGTVLIQGVSSRLSGDVKRITSGLARMRTDLRHTIRPPSGEIGAIAIEINEMAQALLDARSLTENILHSIADGVIAVDPGGVITSINPAAEQIVGVRAAGVIGRPYQAMIADQERSSSALLDTLETGQEHIGIALEYPVNGQNLELNVSSSLMRDSHGTPVGAVVVVKDLTEQSRLKTQIMRADRLAALGELVAGVAHEIRNPLTSIRGFMQALSASDDVREWQRYAPLVVRQVDSLNRIVTELLEFGRPRPPSIRPVQLNDLLREVSLLAGHKAGGRVVLEPAADLPMVEADGEALKQAVLNLIINAFQAQPASGEVHIATAADSGRDAVITVADDGVGIPPENIGKVFDPFFSTKADGTGLGLAMVHRIIDAHNGTITIASTPGAGTVVTLRLPVLHNATELS
ncbi:two-component system sensor histidine kinase AtoS [Azospirillum sp. A39]|uniref:two-component system sensor histidine kinase AtoS n=1 Tax=Azospirillum sp. A39 TaxID=3462279 RepID=UPI00404618F3